MNSVILTQTLIFGQTAAERAMAAVSLVLAGVVHPGRLRGHLPCDSFLASNGWQASMALLGT